MSNQQDIDNVREKWDTSMRSVCIVPPPPRRITNGYSLYLKRQEEKRKMSLLRRILAEIQDWFEA